MKGRAILIFLYAILLLPANSIFAQKGQKEKTKISARDTSKSQSGMSDSLTGFSPTPVIIMKPMLKGSGKILTPVHVQTNKARNTKEKTTPPPITVKTLFGDMFNDAWLINTQPIDTNSKWDFRYTIETAYADINMDYYFDIDEPSKKKAKISFRDTLDHRFDMSDFLINKNGFMPIPVIITEPSLGGFGGGLAPVFIEVNKSRNVKGKIIPMPPNITAVMGGGTLNGTWFVGGGRVGSISKWGVRYTVGAAYANINMDYYFNIDELNKNINTEFNIRTIPVMVSVEKQFRDPRFSVGLEYLFMHNTLKIRDSADKPFKEKIDSLISGYISGNVAKLGIKALYDGRDNTFTPNKGLKAYLTADWSHPGFGSDYKFGQFEAVVYYYFPIIRTLITGIRFDMQQVVGDIPFYIKPYVDMRGVPSARYQGNTTILLELEERWDFTRRWSLVAFGGAGKGFDSFSDFENADWAWSCGVGFRYLMARLLKLRVGVDFAVGPQGFTYYIIFGSSWTK